MSTSIVMGVGVMGGVLTLLAVVLVGIGICSSKLRVRSLNEEMERRRRALHESRRLEQERWREQRLRQVVRLLIEHGEAEEGVPLAFQLPNHAEVLARRPLPWNNRLRSVMDDEDDAHSPLTRAVTHMTLEELLPNGRPADATPGPDIMQMLLDGHELRQQSYISEMQEQFTSSDNESTAEVASSTGAQGGISSTVSGPGTNIQASSHPRHRPLTQGGQEDAIFRELRSERRRMQRRRKTAEDIYGVGSPYLRNPANDIFLCETGGRGKDNSVSIKHPRPTSTLLDRNYSKASVVDAQSPTSVSMVGSFYQRVDRPQGDGPRLEESARPTAPF